MIRQQFDVNGYWRVIVFYNADYDFLCDIVKDLHQTGFPKDFIKEVMTVMYLSLAMAVTCSNVKEHMSIIIFNPHPDKQEYMNSIVHEAEHIKQAMLYAYQVKDAGEPPAYTIGYLVGRMYEVFRDIICDGCDY